MQPSRVSLLDTSRRQIRNNMEWSREKTIEFIEEYKTHTILWDRTHPMYQDRYARHEALLKVANKLNTITTEVERKIKNLQSHFLRERKRVLQSKNKHCSTWFAYKPLSFLLSRNMVRKIRPSPAAVKECNSRPTVQNTKISIPDDGNDQAIAESFVAMKHVIKLLKDRDEYDLYGEQVALKLRNLQSPVARVTVQNKMNTLLLQAEMGMYDMPNRYNSEASDFEPNPEYPSDTKIEFEENIIDLE